MKPIAPFQRKPAPSAPSAPDQPTGAEPRHAGPARPRMLEALRVPALMPVLDDSSVRALSRSSRDLQALFGPERAVRRATRFIIESPTVSAHQLRQRLGIGAAAADGDTVRSLPPYAQARALVALGGRLLAMPPADRPQAIADFLAFPIQPGEDRVLDDLRQAAMGGEQGLVEREMRLTARGGEARIAVERGESIVTASQRLGIGGEQGIEALVTAAIPRARNEVDRGEPIPTVARRLGIRTAAGIQELHQHVTRGLHPLLERQAVAAPEDLGPRLGIWHPMVVNAIRHRAALQAVASARLSVGQAARRFGIAPRDAAWTLEPHAARTAGEQAVRALEPVAEVVQRLGITQPELVLRLERRAVDLAGPALARMGHPGADIATRLGVVAPEHLQRLHQLAANAAARRERQPDP